MNDYAAKNPRAKYCKYCTNAEGMLKSPQEHIQRLIAFIMEDEKLPEEKARDAAIKQMKKFPAWKGKV